MECESQTLWRGIVVIYGRALTSSEETMERLEEVHERYRIPATTPPQVIYSWNTDEAAVMKANNGFWLVPAENLGFCDSKNDRAPNWDQEASLSFLQPHRALVLCTICLCILTGLPCSFPSRRQKFHRECFLSSQSIKRQQDFCPHQHGRRWYCVARI